MLISFLQKYIWFFLNFVTLTPRKFRLFFSSFDFEFFFFFFLHTKIEDFLFIDFLATHLFLLFAQQFQFQFRFYSTTSYTACKALVLDEIFQFSWVFRILAPDFLTTSLTTGQLLTECRPKWLEFWVANNEWMVGGINEEQENINKRPEKHKHKPTHIHMQSQQYKFWVAKHVRTHS